MNHLDVYDPLMVTFLLFLPVLNHPLPLELFVYLRLIIGILSLLTSAHLTVLSLFNPALNLTFSLLPITSSHPHASASDSTFDYWRYINIWLTLHSINCHSNDGDGVKGNSITMIVEESVCDCITVMGLVFYKKCSGWLYKSLSQQLLTNNGL